VAVDVSVVFVGVAFSYDSVAVVVVTCVVVAAVV